METALRGLFLIIVLISLSEAEYRQVGSTSISTESGQVCVGGWRTCPCGPLLDQCTVEDSYGRAWCATEVDPISRIYVAWDWCDRMANCSCKTESKKLCQAFGYKNVSYEAGSCTFADSPTGQPWCATVPNQGDVTGPAGGTSSNWDYCNEHCGVGSTTCPACPPCP